MSFAIGMSWLKHSKDYSDRFGEKPPDWICTYDLPRRLALLRAALRLGWKLPSTVLIRDEFHSGPWSAGGGMR